MVRGARRRVRDPVTEDDDADDAVAHGHSHAGRPAAESRSDARGRRSVRRFPDLDLSLEMMLRRMVGLLFIEVSAFHTFAWAEAVLSDTDLVAGDGEAAELVRCIRADETPHVDYLRTALTEMRDRTFVGESGRTIAGTEVIGTLWDAALEQSLGAEPRALPASTAMARARARARRQRRAAPRSSRASTRSAARARQRGRGMKFGIFYEHQLPRPWTEDSEYQLIQDALEQIEFADKLGIELRLGGRAPLPRGVLALERTRGVPRGRVAAHEEHPARPRHRADAAAVQPSGAHRRAHLDARPRLERPRRLRHRRVVVRGRARRVHGRPRRRSARCGKRDCASRCGA